MGRRLRRASTVPGRVSPRPSFNLCRYDEDIWIEIAKHLDGKSLAILGTANKWFNRVVMHDNIWKHVCLRDLDAKDPGPVGFKWNKLYTSAFDWMRIGSFRFDSPLALLTGKLFAPQKIPQEEDFEEMLKSSGSIVLKNVKTGVWIADMQAVRCPVCDLDTCDGNMTTLDARHMELFLSEGFLNGTWEYNVIGTQDIAKNATVASGAIFDIKHLNDRSTLKIFNHNLWMGKAEDRQQKTITTEHAVAFNSDLEENNEGFQVKYHVMTAGNDGEVVSIRVSIQSV